MPFERLCIMLAEQSYHVRWSLVIHAWGGWGVRINPLLGLVCFIIIHMMEMEIHWSELFSQVHEAVTGCYSSGICRLLRPPEPFPLH